MLTVSLHCEVPGLGKPKAALFAFAMSLMASNALAVVRASLRAAHGKEAEAEVSGYYLADEVAAEYRTLAKYVPAEKWKGGAGQVSTGQRPVRLFSTCALLDQTFSRACGFQRSLDHVG